MSCSPPEAGIGGIFVSEGSYGLVSLYVGISSFLHVFCLFKEAAASESGKPQARSSEIRRERGKPAKPAQAHISQKLVHLRISVGS